MAKKLEFWGALGTTVYLAIIAITVANKFDSFLSLELNALGDFLAGVFGPVAFLWLVLGFLQQGRELKLSTDALQLQAEELSRSVEQQKIMASAALEQIEASRQDLIIRQSEAERAIAASFEARVMLKTGGDHPHSTLNKVKIENYGNRADQVFITLDPPFFDVAGIQLGLITNGGSFEVDLNIDKSRANDIGELGIAYVGMDGKSRYEYFFYTISPEFWISFKKKRD